MICFWLPWVLVVARWVFVEARGLLAVAPQPCDNLSRWDLSSPPRDYTQVPCTGRWTPNHWTTSKVLSLCNSKHIQIHEELGQLSLFFLNFKNFILIARGFF